ncbi:MAG: hypothetical protein MZW92_05670 [Comamonadaceae bacterium]|nr:hypothetical protein [Comamonadaceae bacterium]
MTRHSIEPNPDRAAATSALSRASAPHLNDNANGPPRMDLSRVYRKTQQGEEALKGRARLHGQRLRSLLILVDGQATAKELCDKVGSKYRPRATLGQLEHLGLIEPVGDTRPPATAEEDLPVVADAVEAERASRRPQARRLRPNPRPSRNRLRQRKPEPESRTPAAPEPESGSPAAAAASSLRSRPSFAPEPPLQEVPAAADAAAAGSAEVAPEPEPPAACRGRRGSRPHAQEQDANATDPGLEPVVADEPPQRPSPLAEAFDSPQSRHEDRIAVESLWQRLASATEPLRRREWKLKPAGTPAVVGAGAGKRGRAGAARGAGAVLGKLPRHHRTARERGHRTAGTHRRHEPRPVSPRSDAGRRGHRRRAAGAGVGRPRICRRFTAGAMSNRSPSISRSTA